MGLGFEDCKGWVKEGGNRCLALVAFRGPDTVSRALELLIPP